MRERIRQRNATENNFDIIVIGAGIAGTCAAAVLSRQGYDVALVDARTHYQDEFRAEKIGDEKMAIFDRLGLGEIARQFTTPMQNLWVYRYGQLSSRSEMKEYGFRYAALINGLRGSLLTNVQFIQARADKIETDAARQKVMLSNGKELMCRLVILATGLGDAARRSVGIRRVDISKTHSLALGFNLALEAPQFPFEALTYYGTPGYDRSAFLTLFPIGKTMRGNLFSYHALSDPWIRQLRVDPQHALSETMPAIAQICGNFSVTGKVEIRPIDLTITENFRREGLVLVGDAFCSTCPVPGVGIQRAMIDVERLCKVHVPKWFESAGMGADKISAFYDDPVKATTDRNAIHSSHYSRDLTVNRRSGVGRAAIAQRYRAKIRASGETENEIEQRGPWQRTSDGAAAGSVLAGVRSDNR